MVRFNDLTISEKGDKAARFDKLAVEIDAAISGDAGIADDVADLKTAVGNAETGLVKDVADIETAIGDEETAGSILARIKALEDAG